MSVFDFCFPLYYYLHPLLLQMDSSVKWQRIKFGGDRIFCWFCNHGNIPFALHKKFVSLFQHFEISPMDSHRTCRHLQLFHYSCPSTICHNSTTMKGSSLECCQNLTRELLKRTCPLKFRFEFLIDMFWAFVVWRMNEWRADVSSRMIISAQVTNSPINTMSTSSSTFCTSLFEVLEFLG